MSKMDSEPGSMGIGGRARDEKHQQLTLDVQKLREKLPPYFECPPLSSVVTQLLEIEGRERMRHARVIADKRHPLGAGVGSFLAQGRSVAPLPWVDALIPEGHALDLVGLQSTPVPANERLWVVVSDSGEITTYLIDVRQVTS